ncbi:MAG: hypothetical protein ACW97A_04790 [Candidatus Thorarchaeota archaeon]|jgi:hypothetical protein
MNKMRIGFSVLFIAIMLMTPMMVITDSGSAIVTDETQSNRANLDVQRIVEQEEQDDMSSSPLVVSLNGDPIDSIPDFVYLDGESSDSSSPVHFAIAAVDPLKPNITAVYYQNMTAGDEGWVTWMQPGGVVKIWFKVKGPISVSGTVIEVRFTKVVSESTAYGSVLGQSSMNIVDIDANETGWFSWQFTLPDDIAGNYGWGSGKCNAFALSLYQPFLIIPPQAFEVFYEGLYDKYSYLHMFGEVRVKSLTWYNYTYDDPTPLWIPCQIAERNWAVFPEFEYYVINAPIWDIQLRADMRRDIVWWPDETIIPYDAKAHTKLFPGTFVYRPELTGSWMGWLLEEPWEYGSMIGQTRGLYMKFHLYSGTSWSEIYSSNDVGELLLLVESMLDQPPQIEILSPMDGEVVEQSTVNLQALISDPNYNYQITDVQLLVDGVASSVTHLYDPLTGVIETTIPLSGSIDTVNITLLAIDSDGLRGTDTVIITTENPLEYFPASYTSSYQHVDKVLASQVFEWSFPLTYAPSIDLNVTITPTVEIGFSTSIGFDIYYSRPSEVFAGEDFSTYVSVSDPVISCSMWITFDIDFDISVLSFWSRDSITLFDETWIASKAIPLGIEILDLRYDLPGISEFVRSFTHYRIGFLDMIPLLGDFANLDLLIDIIPLLKLSSIITADIDGTNCVPDRDDITFVSDKMFAITSAVDSDASGGLAEVLLNNVNLESTVGLDLSVNLTLTGGVLGFTLASVDMNQWLYDNLGIRVPTISLWNSKVTLPLTSQITLDTDVAFQQLDIGMTGISADEEYINVNLLLEDERGNGVEASSVIATVDSVSCTVNEISNGEYTVLVPYRSTEFTLSVTFSKSGYIGGADTFDIYIDPLIVDSTPPSIASLSMSPEPPGSADSVLVSASMVDTLTGVVNPTLYYSTNNGQSWDSVSMTVVSGTTYEGIIPAQTAGTDVLYYIQVYDGAGNEMTTGQQTYTVGSGGTTPSTPTTSETPTGTEPPPVLGGILQILLLVSLGVVCAVIVAVFYIKKRS